ncbi:MAG: hypothetical protein HRU12_08360 [Phaeodactylibacter sp.]|nr:hypothetical protein [Phaeodactylibacter sp.]
MSALTVKVQAPPPIAVPQVIEASAFCACNFVCEFREKVFADSSGDGYKADKTSFLFRRITSNDTIDMSLHKAGSKVADLTDDTYGTYYGSFTAQPLYRGYLLDWTTVFSAFGSGQYQVKVDLSILGVDTTFESWKFTLLEFSEEEASDTVKMETWHTGNIIGNEFDYTDLLTDGWYESIRLPGTFGEMKADLTEDNYYNSNYDVVSIRPSVKRNYNLTFRLIPDEITYQIGSKHVLANRLAVSDYNVFNTQSYKQHPVKIESMSDPDYKRNTGKSNVELTCKDFTENLIQRN